MSNSVPARESVWDYPRPPRLERSSRRIRVLFAGRPIAETTAAYRVLETSHPPVYYVPAADIDTSVLAVSAAARSFCEFKGRATYYDLAARGTHSIAAAWAYASPSPAFAPIAHYLAFYPSRVEACYVDDERVLAQPGDFYGGWITQDVVGPFKGAPGTWGW